MRGGSEYNRALSEGDQNITEPYERGIRISQSHMRGGSEYNRALCEGVIRIKQNLMGWDRKKITEPYLGRGRS